MQRLYRKKKYYTNIPTIKEKAASEKIKPTLTHSTYFYLIVAALEKNIRILPRFASV